MKLRVLGVLVGLGVLVAATACTRAFTKDRFELIQVGVDDRTDVREILGKPTADLNDQWFFDDVERHYSAVVFFDPNGRVSGKEWMDARSGAWEGRNPHANEAPAGEVRERTTKTRRIDDD